MRQFVMETIIQYIATLNKQDSVSLYANLLKLKFSKVYDKTWRSKSVHCNGLYKIIPIKLVYSNQNVLFMSFS